MIGLDVVLNEILKIENINTDFSKNNKDLVCIFATKYQTSKLD